MKMVSCAIPESLVEYVKLQVLWVQEKRTGSLTLNFFQGGVTNCNRTECLKLTVALSLAAEGRAPHRGPHETVAR